MLESFWARIYFSILLAVPYLVCAKADQIFCQEAHEPQQYWLCLGVEICFSFPCNSINLYCQIIYFVPSIFLAICWLNSHVFKMWLFKKFGTFNTVFVISSTCAAMSPLVSLLLLIIFPNHWWLSDYLKLYL